MLARVVVPASLLVGELRLLTRSLYLIDHQEIAGGMVRDGEGLVVLGDLTLVACRLAIIPEDILGGALDAIGHL